MNALCIAVMCDARAPLTAWQIACIEALRDEEVAPVALLDTGPLSTERQSWPRRRYEAWVGYNCAGLRPALAPPALGLPILPAGTKRLGIHAVLAFTPPPPGFVAPPDGLWTVMAGEDVLQQGDALPGSREIAAGAAVIEVRIVTKRDGVEGHRMLHAIALPVLRSHARTVDAVLAAVPGLLRGAVRRLRHGSLPRHMRVASAAAPPVGLPRLFFTPLLRAARRIPERLFLVDDWHPGRLTMSVGALLSEVPLPAPHWLVAPRPGHFHADPFPVSVGGRDYLLYEAYCLASRRGWIEACTIEVDGTPAEARVALDLGCHMSFPSLVREGDATWCVPEVAAVGGLRLFRMGASPWDWEAEAVMLPQERLVDPVIFRHEGLWWLLATRFGLESELALHGWHASVLGGPWLPHPLNPLTTDVRSARSAGQVFRFGEALLRPAQDCSGDYGRAITLNRILRLDPKGFEERPVARISPAADWRYRDGLHTLNVLDDYIIIDAKRRVIDVLAPLRPWLARRRGGTAARRPLHAEPAR